MQDLLYGEDIDRRLNWSRGAARPQTDAATLRTAGRLDSVRVTVGSASRRSGPNDDWRCLPVPRQSVRLPSHRIESCLSAPVCR